MPDENNEQNQKKEIKGLEKEIKLAFKEERFDAAKRFRAIQELSALGSGFKLALQDMEIRGAGNLLGRSQSGHISAVGLEYYTQLMEKAVKELRGEEVIEEIRKVGHQVAEKLAQEHAK